MNRFHKFKYLVFFLPFALSACSLIGGEDLREWVKDQDKRIPRKKFSIVEDKDLNVPSFNRIDSDPFQKSRIPGLNEESKKVEYKNFLKTSPLTAAALGDIDVVGVLINKETKMAIIKLNGVLFKVFVGSKLGLNNGRVTAIDGDGVHVTQNSENGNGKRIISKTVIPLKK